LDLRGLLLRAEEGREESGKMGREGRGVKGREGEGRKGECCGNQKSLK